MARRLLQVALLALVCASTHANDSPGGEQPLTVFGVRLMQPLPYQECDGKRFGGGAVFSYTPPVNTPCFEQADTKLQGSGKLPDRGTVFLKYPIAQRPELAKGGVLGIGILHGLVQSIGFNTMGLEAQDRDFSTLQQKFGQPSSVKHPVLQNGFGATYQGTVADWDLPGDVHVHFDAAFQNLAQGSVLVQTKAAADDTSSSTPTSGTKL